MPTASIDGITTRYETAGTGPPLLMFSPGGFDGKLDNWRTQGIYRRLNLLDALPEHYTCIAFDKRESGESGGRLERITWADYAAQGKGLLDHLGIDTAHLMGGCVGCSIATAFAAAYPASVSSMVLYSPAGGAKYRISQHQRMSRHLAFVAENGLGAVVRLAKSSDDGYSKDPRVGPWVSVIRRDDQFADSYAGCDPERYAVLLTGMVRSLFDRDSVPGVEPEQLMALDVPALVVPGQDASHATSAARFLEECLPRAQYWDATVEEQTADTAPARILEFLKSV